MIYILANTIHLPALEQAAQDSGKRAFSFIRLEDMIYDDFKDVQRVIAVAPLQPVNRANVPLPPEYQIDLQREMDADQLQEQIGKYFKGKVTVYHHKDLKPSEIANAL